MHRLWFSRSLSTYPDPSYASALVFHAHTLATRIPFRCAMWPQNTEFYILLDVVFTHLPYAKTIQKEIRNDLFLTEEENLFVEVPTADCILGDKLTAFAPHTTGVLLGTGKELEIAKQLFDTAILSDSVADFDLFSRTYDTVVADETAFRGESWSKEKACKVMYLASCLLSGNPLKKIEQPESYLSEHLEGNQYKKLAYVRKQRPDAYARLVEATRNLK